MEARGEIVSENGETAKKKRPYTLYAERFKSYRTNPQPTDSIDKDNVNGRGEVIVCEIAPFANAWTLGASPACVYEITHAFRKTDRQITGRRSMLVLVKLRYWSPALRLKTTFYCYEPDNIRRSCARRIASMQINSIITSRGHADST